MKKILKLLLLIAICINSCGSIVLGEEEEIPLYADRKAEMPQNYILNPFSIAGYSGVGAGANTYTYPRESADKKSILFTRQMDKKEETYWDPYGMAVGSGKTAAKFNTGNYVVSVWLKNANPEVESVDFAVGIAGNSVYGDRAVWTVTNTEWQEFKGIINAKRDNLNDLDVGIPRTYKNDGGTVALATSQEYYTYVAPEAVTELKVTRTDDNDVIDGDEVIAFKAEPLNQIGLEPVSETGEIEWFVVNRERTALADGFTVNAESDSVSISAENALPGEYAVVARCNAGDTILQSGIDIEVLPPKINDNDSREESTRNYVLKLEKTDGEDTIGIFDKIIYKASMGNAENNSEGYNQSFKWYVIDEDRRNIITNAGIKLTVSEDTQTASVTLENSAVNGHYYIVAESIADESADMRKSMPFTIDTSSTITDIIENLNTNTSEQIAVHIKDYAEILNVPKSAFEYADAAEWSNIVKASLKNTVIADETQAKELLEQAAIVSLYNKNENNVNLYDENDKFIYASELELNAIDTDGIKIYSLFDGEDAMMSAEGRKALQKALADKKFESIQSFKKILTEEILLNAICYTDKLGSGYIESILTAENLKAVGISAPEYIGLSDKSGMNSYLAGNLYTIQTLKDALKKASDYGKNNNNTSGGGSKSSGGSSGSGGRTTKETYAPVVINNDKAQQTDRVAEMMLPYKDVISEHWAYSDIYYLTVRGIFSGKDAEHFAPDDEISREEFVKLICKAFDLKDNNTEINFDDVVKNEWYYPYIKTAVNNNIVNGISEKTFGIGQSVLRQDICVLLVRALGVDLSGEESDTTFSDAGDVDEYAKSAVAYLSSLSAINGFEDGSFKPKDTCTRAQAAKILRSVLNIKGALTNE